MSLPISRSSFLFVHPRILHLFLELFRQSCSSPYPSPVSSPPLRSLASLSPSRLTPMSIFPYRLIRKERFLSRRPALVLLYLSFPLHSILSLYDEPAQLSPLLSPATRARVSTLFLCFPSEASSSFFPLVRLHSTYKLYQASATYLRD